MIPRSKTWYKEGWSLDIISQSWTEDTVRQVDFIIDALNLKGSEKILDLACGFGRHSLELARRGFDVTGVDITREYVEFVSEQAKAEGLTAEFIYSDIRDLSFCGEFDVVLNMADGAIGYLEDDGENLKIFDVVARALRPGGKHFMDIMSADYADSHFPCNLWDAGIKALTLSRFEWDPKSKIMLYGQRDFVYGETLSYPEFGQGDPIRLYHLSEIKQIMSERNMAVKNVFGKFDGTSGSENEIQMLVYSEKSGDN